MFFAFFYYYIFVFRFHRKGSLNTSMATKLSATMSTERATGQKVILLIEVQATKMTERVSISLSR